MNRMKKYINYVVALSIILLFLIPGLALAQENTGASTAGLRIIKPVSSTINNYSGDELHQTVGQKMNQPIRVRVLNKYHKPAANIMVYFSIVKVPSKAKDTLLQSDSVLTNKDGIAENIITLGSKTGVYEISARIYESDADTDIVFFRIHGRKTSWVIFLIIGLIGGLAMFLFGMEMMSEGMKKAAGSNLRSILGTLTNNRFLAVGVGTFVTMVIQSSSATTVMLVSFVQAQLMTFSQSLGIILGADIGTTITAQLIAFKITDYALLMIGIGFIFVFLGKTHKYKNIGETILGFGLLFFGMKIMSDAMHPLRTYEPFINLLLQLENPLWGIFIGTAFTALIQSSSAFTGIIIVLASQGLLTLDAGIPLLFGSNIGTCITAILASIKASREAKRVALAHTLFKIFGVILFFWWIPYFSEIVRWISPAGLSSLSGAEHLADVVPRQIANAHTLFNVSLTIIVFPFTKMAANWIIKLLPDVADKEEESPYKTKFLDESIISTPALALSLAKVEIIRLSNKVQKMVEKIIDPFLNGSYDTLDEIDINEEEIDFLETKITKYLTKIGQQDVNEARIEEVFQMMHTSKELEQIADIVSTNLKPLARKKLKNNCRFSEQGAEEIIDYHRKTLKQISRAIEVFKDVNLEKAKKMEKKYRKYRLMEMSLRRTHFARLQRDIPETVASSAIHVELMELLKRISSHATNIARILIEQTGEINKHD